MKNKEMNKANLDSGMVLLEDLDFSEPIRNIGEVRRSGRLFFITVWGIDTDSELLEIMASKPDWDFRAKQEVAPETGRKHYHMLVRTPSPRNFDTIVRFFETATGIHPWVKIVLSRDYNRIYNYVVKPDTASGSPIGGLKPNSPTRTRVEALKAAKQGIDQRTPLMDVIDAYPELVGDVSKLGQYEALRKQQYLSAFNEPTKTTFMWGPTGTGKTRYIRENFDPMDTYFLEYDPRDQFSGYNGQKTLVLDEFTGQIKLPFLNRLLDRYAIELPSRYYNKWRNWNEVVIIANAPLTAFYREEQEQQPDLFNALIRRIDNFWLKESLDAEFKVIGKEQFSMDSKYFLYDYQM